ncbi:MAG: DNA replication and repair protein RecF, partial [Parvularculaceae bacterium]
VARVDGASARGPGAFAERVRFLWLTPAQDRLFLEGAGERRRFLDRMALARDAAHARVASDYETAMRERQRLLEDGPREASWLQALEARMAAAGVALAAARRETAASLAAAQSAEGAVDLDAYGFPRADVALAGDVEAALGEAPADAVEDAFRARLLALRRRDAEAGRSTYGPHRTDLRVAHRAKGQPARLCSTGEQKALLVGLVLANALTLARGAGAPIVVLLDEIAAHLDADRRAALYDVIEATGLQAFMTGTDKDLFAAWGGRAQGFAIGDGDARETALGG